MTTKETKRDLLQTRIGPDPHMYKQFGPQRDNWNLPDDQPDYNASEVEVKWAKS